MPTKKKNLIIGLGVVGAGIGLYFLTREVKAAPWQPPAPPPGLGNLYGTVTDEATSAPIVGAGVWVPGLTVFTDSKGRYVIPGLTPGNYTVSFNAVGYIFLDKSIRVNEGNNEMNAALVSFL